MDSTEYYPPRLRHHLLAEFKAALRELRERAGRPTLRTMCRDTDVSVATMSRAETGDLVPSLLTTITYVEACDGDRRLWANQHHDLQVSLSGAPTTKRIVFVPWADYFDQEKAPPPTIALLRREMRRMWLTSGMTLQEIAEQTKQYRWVVGKYPLGASTISELCNPDVVRVPRRRTIHAFMLALRRPPASIERWLAARNQLAANYDPRLSAIPPGDPGIAIPPTPPTPAGSVDPGQQRYARLRRLHSDLTQRKSADAIPRQRIRNVLTSLGVDPAVIASVAPDPALSVLFVRRLHQTTGNVIAETNLPASATALALEVAVSRVSAEYQRL